MEGNGSSPETCYQLSDVQDKALLLLPIPSALLSIVGSTTIIFMTVNRRHSQKFTPYKRLLLGLSVSDIIFTMAVSTGGFMRPRYSHRAFSFGNDATCIANGFFTQLSYTSFLYNAMLQYYFLLTARYGWSNDDLSKRVEPLMHAFAIGYPFITATVGAIIDAYSETMFGLGCWINEWPRGCNSELGNTGHRCYTSMLGWVFAGWLILFTFMSIFICQVMIWRFVRLIRTRTSAIGNAEEGLQSASSSHAEDVLVSTSLSGEKCGSKRHNPSCEQLPIPGMEQPEEHSMGTKKQLKRLRLVSSQAFLFVASFFICSVWMFILGTGESRASSSKEEMKMKVDRYPILVLSSAFTPLQGFLNLIVYMRPKWIRFRTEYPAETRYWVANRIIFHNSIVGPSNGGGGRQVQTVANEQRIKGDSLPPSQTNRQNTDAKEPTQEEAAESRMSSSSSPEAAADIRWEGSTNRQSHAWVPLKAAPRHESAIVNGSIESISEVSDAMTNSFVVHSTYDADYRHEVDHEMSELRWGPETVQTPSTESTTASNGRWEGSGNRLSHAWVPLKAARRHESSIGSTKGSVELMSEVSDSMNNEERWRA